MKVKGILATLAACTICLGASAQELQPVKLNAPDKTRGAATMKALSDRHSDRVYDEKELSLKDLSDLLWAANGINRPDGKRTAPSAMDKREIDVYLIRKDGAYLYDPQEHALKPVAKGDHRGAVAGGQDFVNAAPVSLVMVIDLERLGDPAAENTRLIGAVDAGIVTQNINIFCAGTGLSTVPRATMDKDELRRVLKLKNTQLPIMNNPVGYPKK
ncbi:MAG: SagB/ThcOx family dehydrogenase [Tannerella sp.]|jgi:SagB-type dehydrogenase family enzyme|nr:SagB/ThcOx family dehydrogenase [Tannerella sp.]